VIREVDREAEAMAHRQAKLQRRRWRGPLAFAAHIGIATIAMTRLDRLIGALARRADLHSAQLTEVDVPIAGLPAALVGLRIGHLSDFHIGPNMRPADVRPALALLQAAAPDLIVLTGDLVDHWPRDTVPAAQLLADLAAPLGVYGVFGNHDHRVGASRLLAALGEHAPQVRMLVNDTSRVSLPTGELWVAGLDSVYLRLADPARALAAVPPEAPCLLLTHEPDIADHLPRSVTLILAGHAHGGQIRIGGRPLLLPPLARRHHTGLNWSAAGPVYTSRGVGWTGLPLRLDCPAEVAVLRLVPAEA
jgi:predicted MPP superfamily phosphohydrolase